MRNSKKIHSSPKTVKPPMPLKKKLLIVLMCVMSVVGAGFITAGAVLNNFKYTPDKKVNTLTDTDLGIKDDPSKSNDITNIALYGVDSRNNDLIKGNSDCIMIISLDHKHNKIKISSILRDSLVPVEGCSTPRKITEAYGIGGAELALKTLNKAFNMNIRDYATVNFSGMADIIDAVGGIDATLTDAEVKNANKQITPEARMKNVSPTYIKKAGTQHLNGIQAVAYARIRYVNTPDGQWGDLGRSDRQRYVMEQLFNKAIKMPVTQYPGLAKKLLPYMNTSLTYSDIISLAGIMLNKPTFEQARLPVDKMVISYGYKVNGGSTVYYNYEYAAKILNAFIYDDIKPEDYIAQNGVDKTSWYNNGTALPGQNGNSGPQKTTTAKTTKKTTSITNKVTTPVSTPSTDNNQTVDSKPEQTTQAETTTTTPLPESDPEAEQ